MTPKTKIKKLIKTKTQSLNQSLEEFHQFNNFDQHILFWEELAYEYVDSFREQVKEPRYQFDKEWSEFWDYVEKEYPQFILKSTK